MPLLHRLTLGFFQLSGLCTFTDPPQPKVERLLLLWNLTHMLALALITGHVIANPTRVFFTQDAIGTITDVIQLACPFLAHFVVLAEAIRTKALRSGIWRQLHDIDGRLVSLRRHPEQSARVARNSQLGYLRKVCAAHLICVATEVRIMSCIGANKMWSNLWQASIFTLVTIRSHHFYYIWFVDELKWRMNVHCAELERCGGGDGLCERDHQLLRVLRVVRENHGQMWLVAERMNEVFGWTLLTTITANFVCLSVNLYWNYAALYFGSNRFWVESLLGSFPLAVEVVVLCYSCEQWQEAASNFSTPLHRLRTNRKPCITSMIRLFSLQIRLQKFRLSARGFFDINFDLLKGIIAAIATYMLIFIQFMPSDDVFYEGVTNPMANVTHI